MLITKNKLNVSHIFVRTVSLWVCICRKQCLCSILHCWCHEMTVVCLTGVVPLVTTLTTSQSTSGLYIFKEMHHWLHRSFEYIIPPSKTDHIELWYTSVAWRVSYVSIVQLLKIMIIDVCLQMLTSLSVLKIVTSTSYISSAASIFVSSLSQSLEIGNILLLSRILGLVS